MSISLYQFSSQLIEFWISFTVHYLVNSIIVYVARHRMISLQVGFPTKKMTYRYRTMEDLSAIWKPHNLHSIFNNLGN